MFSLGTIHVKPKEANLTRDTQMLVSMSPYCVFRLGEQKEKSEVKKSAGKKPKFNDHFQFKRTVEDILEVEIWDHGEYMKNKLIGVGQLKISKLLKLGGVYRTPITLYHKKKIAGHLYVDIRLEREDVSEIAFKVKKDEDGSIILEKMRKRRNVMVERPEALKGKNGKQQKEAVPQEKNSENKEKSENNQDKEAQEGQNDSNQVQQLEKVEEQEQQEDNNGVFVDEKIQNGLYPTFDGSENQPIEFLKQAELHPEYEKQISGTTHQGESNEANDHPQKDSLKREEEEEEAKRESININPIDFKEQLSMDPIQPIKTEEYHNNDEHSNDNAQFIEQKWSRGPLYPTFEESIFIIPDQSARKSISSGEYKQKADILESINKYDKVNVEVYEIKPSVDGTSEEKVKLNVVMYKPAEDNVFKKGVGIVIDGLDSAKNGAINVTSMIGKGITGVSKSVVGLVTQSSSKTDSTNDTSEASVQKDDKQQLRKGSDYIDFTEHQVDETD